MDALVMMGNCYEDGLGVTQNKELAVKIYAQVAASGHPYGQIHLGNCYYLGKGIDRNLEEAINWYCALSAKL